MNLSSVIGRPVVDLSSATTIGRVDDAVVDTTAHRIVGFVLGKVAGPATFLPWESMTALGADAVTIADLHVLGTPPGEPGGSLTSKALGARVLTDAGRELAALVDLDIDPTDGAVTSLTLSDRTLPAESLLGIGSYATVVSDPAD
ncbi:MAG: PRC-barrel domain-containing protein [Ilumatobacteraceae bacterium]